MAKGSFTSFAQQIDIRIAAGIIAVVIAIFGGLYYILTRPEKPIIIPPTAEQTTIMVLNGSVERVVIALSTTGKAPKTMAELPALPNGSTPTTDGWNNEVLLKITGGGSRYVAEIRSKGPDGTANNADDIVVDGVIQKDPNSARFFVAAQSQRGVAEPETGG